MDTVLLVLVAIHGAALGVVNLTPTPAPGSTWSKVYMVIEVLAGLLTPLAKQLAEKKDGASNTPST